MLNNQRVQRMFMMLCSRDGERGLKWCHSNHPCNWLLPSYLAVGSMIAWLWKPMLLSSYGSVGWYGATPKKKDTHADHAPYLETSDFRVTINRSNMFLRCINSMPLIVLVIVVIAQWARTHTRVVFVRTTLSIFGGWLSVRYWKNVSSMYVVFLCISASCWYPENMGMTQHAFIPRCYV